MRRTTTILTSCSTPKSFYLGDTINWNAPWLDVIISVELPFWLMVENFTFNITLEKHTFKVFVVDTAFEHHSGSISDSKNSVSFFDLKGDRVSVSSKDKKDAAEESTLRRKCKTILGIMSRCNSDVWEKLSSSDRRERITSDIYLQTLCSAHIPLVNKLIQTYRLLTYDLFVYEVAAWDVSLWTITHNAESKRVNLSRYREWDRKPIVFPLKGNQAPYHLIDGEALSSGLNDENDPSELELLDALNLFQRGDVSGAIRHMITAIEVVVESKLETEMSRSIGSDAMLKFMKKTKNDFNRRVSALASIRGEDFTLWRQLNKIREMRHDIVRRGKRIASSELGEYSKALDIGRWIYNWIENNPSRMKTREGRQAFINLGGSQIRNLFQSCISSEGVLVKLYPGVGPDVMDRS